MEFCIMKKIILVLLLMYPMLLMVGMEAGEKAAVNGKGEKGAVVAEDAEDIDENDDEEEEDDYGEEDLPASPFRLAEGDAIDLGEFTEARRHKFRVTIKNTSDKEVFFKRAMSTCACLKLHSYPDPQKVAPGGMLEIQAELIGWRLGQIRGRWTRTLYIESKGYAEGGISVSGTFSPYFVISPATRMDLGDFEGDRVSWKRTFTIRLTDVKRIPDFKLVGPAESKRFNFKLIQKFEGVFELEVTPKLPLPVGRFSELVFLGTPQINKDMGIRLNVYGCVKGTPPLGVSTNRLAVSEASLKSGKPVEVQFNINQGERLDKSQVMYRRLGLRMPKHRHGGGHSGDIATEEKDPKNARTLKDWQKVSEKLDVTAPAGVTVTKVVTEKGVTFTVKVVDTAMLLEKKRVELELKKKGGSSMPIHLYVGNESEARRNRSTRGTTRRVPRGN